MRQHNHTLKLTAIERWENQGGAYLLTRRGRRNGTYFRNDPASSFGTATRDGPDWDVRKREWNNPNSSGDIRNRQFEAFAYSQATDLAKVRFRLVRARQTSGGRRGGENVTPCRMTRSSSHRGNETCCPVALLGEPTPRKSQYIPATIAGSLRLREIRIIRSRV